MVDKKLSNISGFSHNSSDHSGTLMIASIRDKPDKPIRIKSPKQNTFSNRKMNPIMEEEPSVHQNDAFIWDRQKP